MGVINTAIVILWVSVQSLVERVKNPYRALQQEGKKRFIDTPFNTDKTTRLHFKFLKFVQYGIACSGSVQSLLILREFLFILFTANAWLLKKMQVPMRV